MGKICNYGMPRNCLDRLDTNIMNGRHEKKDKKKPPWHQHVEVYLRKKKVTDYTSLLQIFNRKCIRFLLKSSAKLLPDFFSQ